MGHPYTDRSDARCSCAADPCVAGRRYRRSGAVVPMTLCGSKWTAVIMLPSGPIERLVGEGILRYRVQNWMTGGCDDYELQDDRDAQGRRVYA